MSETFTLLEDGKIFLEQSFSKDFVDIINKIPQKLLNIEALDYKSLDVPYRFSAYHKREKIAGEENANIGTNLHPSHRHGKAYEGLEKMKSYNMLYQIISEKFSKEKADEAILELLSGSIAVNDSSNIDLPYCVAYSSSHLMKDGRKYIEDVPNVAPRNFRSYINMVSESMFDACAEFMGATVVFDILIGMAYYTKHERETIQKVYKEIFSKFPLNSIDVACQMGAVHIMSTKRTYSESVSLLMEKCASIEDVANEVIDFQITNSLQGWVHLMGNKFRQNHQSLFTNISLMSPRILKENFQHYRYPNGDSIDSYIFEICTIQTLFARFFSQGIKGKDKTRIVAMPVVTLMIPNDLEGAKELQNDDDIFIDNILLYFSKYNNINIYRGLKLAMCCRLTVEKLNSVSVNSLGNVSHLDGNDAVGSLRVVTVGLPSIALNAKKKCITFKEELSRVLDLSADILNAQRELVYRRDEQGLFKFSKTGWVKFEKLASTFGGVGIYEAVKIHNNSGYGTPYTEEDLNLANEILHIFADKCEEHSEKSKVTFNMEVSIPAESMAFRLAERDKYNFGNDVEYTELSNQFTPLTMDFGIINKLKVEERLSSEIEPSGICHINVNGPLNPLQNIRMHRKLWKMFPNVQHYAFTDVIYLCSQGHLETHTVEGTCASCRSNIIDETTRSIGYFKSTRTDFGPKRADEFKRRKWFNVNEVEESIK